MLVLSKNRLLCFNQKKILKIGKINPKKSLLLTKTMVNYKLREDKAFFEKALSKKTLCSEKKYRSKPKTHKEIYYDN